MKKLIIVFLLFSLNSIAQKQKYNVALGGNFLLDANTDNLYKQKFINDLNLNLLVYNKIQVGIGKENNRGNFIPYQSLKSDVYFKLRYYFLNDSLTHNIYFDGNYHAFLSDGLNEIDPNNSTMFDLGIGCSKKINSKISLNLTMYIRHIYAENVYLTTKQKFGYTESNNILIRFGLLYKIFKK